MREIEVRDLAAQLTSVLREVEDGRTVRITADGHPVADIVPASPKRSEAMKKLIAEGKVTPASGSIPKDPPPPRKTGRSASAIILAEREEER